MTPRPAGRLSEGLRIEARIGARLLGLPLLRLDADIVVLPAREVDAESDEDHPDFTARLPHPRQESAPPGSALARAIALVEQCGDNLRQPAPRRPRSAGDPGDGGFGEHRPG